MSMEARMAITASTPIISIRVKACTRCSRCLLMILICFLCWLSFSIVLLVSTVYASRWPASFESVFKALPLFTSQPCPDTGDEDPSPANHCDFVAERYRSSYATGSNKPLRMAACRLRDGSLRHPSSIGSVTCPLPWNPSAKGKGIPGSQPLRLCQPLAGDGITLASRQVGTMSSPAKADARLRHPVGRWRALKPGYWFLSGV